MTSEATLLTIGKVTGVHGLAGNLKIWSYAESADTFKKGCTVLLCKEDHPDDPGIPHVIQSASDWKKGVLLRLKGVVDRNGAEALMGYLVRMDKADLPELEEDTWYWQDLIGLKVTDENRGDLGQIKDIFPTGAQDILVIKNGKEEVLVPMHKEFVLSVDLEAGVVETRLPEGL
ncbi:MAG: ribosome maturation factor RimM [Desulfobacterales bacterium]|nr:ribosome maturation factor RimM [Desulfobacterales bacterium]